MGARRQAQSSLRQSFGHDVRIFEGWPRASIVARLEQWGEACARLRAVRRAPNTKKAQARETRLDARVATLERQMMLMLWRETFGRHVPKKARAYSPRA